MFFRGGLLIEPWKPFHYYTNDPKIQSVVLFEDVVYTCNLAHQSGETFLVNADKFTSAGSGGGTGGGSLEPIGDWDIAASTTSGGIIETPLILSVLTDALSNSQNVIYEAGLNTVPYAGPYYFYGASTTNTVTTDFSTTKWCTFGLTGYNVAVLYDSTGIPAESALVDFIAPLLNAVDSAVPNIAFSFVDVGSLKAISVQYTDILTQNAVPVIQVTSQTVPDLAASLSVSFGINLSLGKIYIETDNIAVQEFDIPTDVLSTANELSFFAGGLYGASFSPASLVLSFPDQQNKPPITQLSEEITVVPPMGANDGELWNVTSSGSYDGEDLNNGDSVIFYNNLEKIVAITHPPVIDVPGIVANTITDALLVNGQITLGVEAILATKHFNSYGGDWNAGGQYDGRLNFTQFTSYVTYGNNLLSLTGDGTLQDDGKYWGLVRDATASFVGGGLSFDLILPFINNAINFIDTDELVVECRQTGTFGDLSPNQKFFRFSFINLDNTGSDPTQIQLTVTYCNGNGTVVSNIAPTLAGIGQRVSFDITTNTTTAYLYITENGSVNLISADPNFTAPEVIAYVGFARPSGGPNMSFILTQGVKDIILPPAPRLYKTYKATNTDAYSMLYNKTIKDNDLVTFILDGNNNENILVESATDLSYTTKRSDFFSVNTSSAQVTALSVDLATAYLTNLTDRSIQISNFTTVSYTTPGDPFTAGITINFNTTANGFDVGRSYVIGDLIQVAFDTRGGNAIENITFESPVQSSIGPFIVDAEKYVVYTFTVMEKDGTPYGTIIRCTSKVEL